MKINFSYTSARILRRNLPFLSGLISLCVVSMLVVYLNIQQFRINADRLSVTKLELEELNKKKSLIDFKNQVIDAEFDLDTANQALTQLIPLQEDYFSILATLDKLSAMTNFIITSYNINIGASTRDRLAILIEGKGDPDSFLDFLKEYNFSGGRLVTIDKIDFSQEAFSGTKININVYSGKTSATESPIKSETVDLDLVTMILSKIQIELKPEAEINVDYPTKSNPF